MKRKEFQIIGIFLLLSLLAVPALAAASGGEEPNIFAGDLGNVIWTLVIFGIRALCSQQIRLGTPAREDAGAGEFHS